MFRPQNVEPLVGRAYNAFRAAALISAVIGLILGLTALFWPTATILTLAWLFGIALIFSGLFRIVVGITGDRLPRGTRWLLGILGVLVVLAGILVLIHPSTAVVFFALMIGFGWIFSGVHDIMVAFSGVTTGSRGWAIAGGVISVIAGVVALFLPGLTIATFVTVGGILLIIVSVVTLFTLPRKVAVN